LDFSASDFTIDYPILGRLGKILEINRPEKMLC